MARLMKEERVIKYLVKFAENSELQDLEDAIVAEDWEAAFRAVHTLKGVSANLGLTRLQEKSEILCEVLRPCVKPSQDITSMLEAIRDTYLRSVELIGELP